MSVPHCRRWLCAPRLLGWWGGVLYPPCPCLFSPGSPSPSMGTPEVSSTRGNSSTPGVSMPCGNSTPPRTPWQSPPGFPATPEALGIPYLVPTQEDLPARFLARRQPSPFLLFPTHGSILLLMFQHNQRGRCWWRLCAPWCVFCIALLLLTCCCRQQPSGLPHSPPPRSCPLLLLPTPPSPPHPTWRFCFRSPPCLYRLHSTSLLLHFLSCTPAVPLLFVSSHPPPAAIAAVASVISCSAPSVLRGVTHTPLYILPAPLLPPPPSLGILRPPAPPLAPPPPDLATDISHKDEYVSDQTGVGETCLSTSCGSAPRGKFPNRPLTVVGDGISRPRFLYWPQQ